MSRREPTIELPPDAVGNIGWRQGPLMAPHATELLAVFGLCLDHQTGARQAISCQPGMHLIRECLGDERRCVDTHRRRVELGLHMALRRNRSCVGWAFVEPRCQPVGEQAVRTEPGDHVGGRNLGNPFEGPQTESPQEIDQRLAVGQRSTPTTKSRDGQRAEETRTRSGVDQMEPFAEKLLIGSEARREEPIGNPDPARERRRALVHSELTGEGGVGVGRHQLDEGTIASEVSRRPTGRERTTAGLENFDTRGEFLESSNDGLETPRITVRVVFEHLETRTSCL